MRPSASRPRNGLCDSSSCGFIHAATSRGPRRPVCPCPSARRTPHRKLRTPSVLETPALRTSSTLAARSGARGRSATQWPVAVRKRRSVSKACRHFPASGVAHSSPATPGHARAQSRSEAIHCRFATRTKLRRVAAWTDFREHSGSSLRLCLEISVLPSYHDCALELEA